MPTPKKIYLYKDESLLNIGDLKNSKKASSNEVYFKSIADDEAMLEIMGSMYDTEEIDFLDCSNCDGFDNSGIKKT